MALEAGKSIQESPLNPAVRARMQYQTDMFREGQRYIHDMPVNQRNWLMGLGPEGVQFIPGAQAGGPYATNFAPWQKVPPNQNNPPAAPSGNQAQPRPGSSPADQARAQNQNPNYAGPELANQPTPGFNSQNPQASSANASSGQQNTDFASSNPVQLTLGPTNYQHGGLVPPQGQPAQPAQQQPPPDPQQYAQWYEQQGNTGLSAQAALEAVRQKNTMAEHAVLLPNGGPGKSRAWAIKMKGPKGGAWNVIPEQQIIQSGGAPSMVSEHTGLADLQSQQVAQAGGPQQPTQYMQGGGEVPDPNNPAPAPDPNQAQAQAPPPDQTQAPAAPGNQNYPTVASDQTTYQPLGDFNQQVVQATTGLPLSSLSAAAGSGAVPQGLNTGDGSDPDPNISRDNPSNVRRDTRITHSSPVPEGEDPNKPSDWASKAYSDAQKTGFQNLRADGEGNLILGTDNNGHTWFVNDPNYGGHDSGLPYLVLGHGLTQAERIYNVGDGWHSDIIDRPNAILDQEIRSRGGGDSTTWTTKDSQGNTIPDQSRKIAWLNNDYIYNHSSVEDPDTNKRIETLMNQTVQSQKMKKSMSYFHPEDWNTTANWQNDLATNQYYNFSHIPLAEQANRTLVKYFAPGGPSPALSQFMGAYHALEDARHSTFDGVGPAGNSNVLNPGEIGELDALMTPGHPDQPVGADMNRAVSVLNNQRANQFIRAVDQAMISKYRLSPEVIRARNELMHNGEINDPNFVDYSANIASRPRSRDWYAAAQQNPQLRNQGYSDTGPGSAFGGPAAGPRPTPTQTPTPGSAGNFIRLPTNDINLYNQRYSELPYGTHYYDFYGHPKMKVDPNAKPSPTPTPAR
jgi:hypothetical protein